MADPVIGCAQNADGSLRDASDIHFYHDVDDEQPISGPGSSASGKPLHPLFSGSIKPLGKIAGSRRSARTIRPSARVCDPDNAEASVSISKRKAAVPAMQSS